MRIRIVRHDMCMRAIVVAIVSLLAMPVIHLRAQTVTGTILGSVLDSSGAAIPNAQITITNQDTGVVRNAVSTAEGVYNVPSLLSGRYTVDAKAQGFNPIQVKDVVVAVGSDSRVDLKLQVGSTSQSVTVQEAAPTVETESTEVSQIMDENLIGEVPLNARDVQQLAVIQPGVQYNFYSSYGKQLSVAGDRSIDNRYLQEGMDLTWTYRTSPSSLPTSDGVMLGVEAVKEFKVISTDSPAEYGEESGGVISMLFKSGTNQMHGSAYEYFRDNYLAARNFFDKTAAAPPLNRNQFGAALGGPIKKDSTFYFVNYEGYRLSASASFLADLPDANARGSGNGNGELPCSGTTATNTGGCGPAPTTLPTGTLVTVPVSPQIYNIFFGGSNPLLPACNGGEVGNGLCAYSSNPVETITEDYGLVKIDHSFGTKNTLSSTYNNDHAHEYEPVQTGANADDQTMHRQTFTAQDTEIISNNVVNTARFGINRIYYLFVEDLTGDPSRYSPSLFVDPNPVYTPSPFPQVPVIAVSGGMTAFGNGVTLNYAPRWIGYTSGLLSDDINYLHGKHAFQFGVQSKKWDDDQEIYSQVSRGSYTFQSLAQFMGGGAAQAFTWIDQSVSNSGRAWRQHMIAFYAEDTYRAKENLTFTYGLRWEDVPGPNEKNNKVSEIWNPTPQTSPGPMVGPPYFTSTKDNFAPRIGFNWDPFKKGTTSVRAGAGIFFNEIEDDTYYSGPYNAPPFATTVTLANTMPFPANLSLVTNALASGTLKQNFSGAIPTNPKTPTKYGYNLTIQQELPDHLTFMVAYVGSQSRHFGRQVSFSDYNPTTTIEPGQVPSLNGVPIPGAVTNPDCTAAGQLQCLYWVGVGVDNANILGSVPSATNTTSQYATLCTTTITKNCYINNNYGSGEAGILFDSDTFYNALETALERRVTTGLYARFNYTYARCITDATDDLPGGDTIGGSATSEPTLDHSAKRGRCSFMGTHAVNFNLTYDFPFGKMVSSGFGKAFLGGWQISSLTTVSSGSPFTITDGINVSRTATSGAGGDRPDWAPGCNPQTAINHHDATNYFNAACFVLPPLGYLGNMGALALTGPTLIDTDLSLKRVFPLRREGMFLEFRADMFNAFNHTNFADPANTTVFTNTGTATAPVATVNKTAGQIQNTVTTSRQGQFSLRFQF